MNLFFQSQNMAACSITNENAYKIWLCGDYVYVWNIGENEDCSQIDKCMPLSENEEIRKLCSSISGE